MKFNSRKLTMTQSGGGFIVGGKKLRHKLSLKNLKISRWGSKNRATHRGGFVRSGTVIIPKSGGGKCRRRSTKKRSSKRRRRQSGGSIRSGTVVDNIPEANR